MGKAPMPQQAHTAARSRRRALQRSLGLLGAAWLATSTAADAPHAAVGEIAPDFSLRDADGRAHRLQAVATTHRVTVLNFWATWCAPCVKELPEFDALWRDARSQGVAVLAVNALESLDKVRAFQARMHFAMPLLLDTEGDALGPYTGFGAALPMTFFVDARGMLRERVAAPLAGSALRERVQGLLATAR